MSHHRSAAAAITSAVFRLNRQDDFRSLVEEYLEAAEEHGRRSVTGQVMRLLSQTGVDDASVLRQVRECCDR